MRYYVMTTGFCFAILVLVHIARIFDEGTNVVTDPFFAGTTLVSTVMTIWALRLLLRKS